MVALPLKSIKRSKYETDRPHERVSGWSKRAKIEFRDRQSAAYPLAKTGPTSFARYSEDALFEKFITISAPTKNGF